MLLKQRLCLQLEESFGGEREKSRLFVIKYIKCKGVFSPSRNGELPIYKHFRENFTPPHLYVRQHLMVERSPAPALGSYSPGADFEDYNDSLSVDLFQYKLD